MAILLSGCQARPDNSVVIGPGSSHTNVLSLLGEPDRVQEFNLPEVPFFGPQESLTDLIPAGTPVEEWVYIEGEEELYVWFAGEEDLHRIMGNGAEKFLSSFALLPTLLSPET